MFSLANGRLPAAVRASVISAFTRSSDALISQDVLLSRNVKTTCTHTLLQRFVLLELSDLSSLAFSQSGSYLMMLLTFVLENQRIIQSIAQAWHRNEAPKSAF